MEERKNSNFKSSIVLSLILVFGIFLAPGYSAEETIPKIGPVKTNPHPSTLEGKTVVLRWNGKYNGDKFLARVGELFIEQVKNVKVIKMWEVDSSTAIISKKMEVSDQIASKIAILKPNMVISAQADWGSCTSWLVVDQLSLEKRGIPTVTVLTTAFEELLKSAMKYQGVSEISQVVVEHPIAGHNLKGIQKMVETAFPEIIKATTKWQPPGK